MEATAAYTHTRPLYVSARPSLFGDVILIVFLLAQCFDGVFTYVGVVSYGLGIEANPLLSTLMGSLGHGPALTGAKVIAAMLGICLHLRRVHSAVAVLTVFYLAVAIVPWMVILFS
jgi:uncharacterized membrane protein